MRDFATITSKGQVTLPKAVRDAFHLKPGDRIEFVRKSDGSLLVNTGQLRAIHLLGILGPVPPGVDLSPEGIDEAIMEAVAEDDERIMREWRDGIDESEEPE